MSSTAVNVFLLLVVVVLVVLVIAVAVDNNSDCPPLKCPAGQHPEPVRGYGPRVLCVCAVNVREIW